MRMGQDDEARVPLPPDVLEEIGFWVFVDTFTEQIPFLLQRHVSVRLFTDASGFAWGASIDLPGGPLELRDYWTSSLFGKDICAKEGLAVLFALQAIQERLYCRRVDVYVDNQGLMYAWNGLKARSEELVGVLRSLFLWTTDFRVSLRLHWIPTDENPADAPSRLLDRSDCMLSAALRRKLWSAYGPFSFDLMALPSNVLRDPSGRPLPFFSRYPVPSAAGTCVFAQSPPSGRLYVYPPFIVITPLLRLLAEWGGVEVVIVLPVFRRQAAWMDLLLPFVQDALPLFARSACGVLQLPSSDGFHDNLLPLPFGMTAFRCLFPSHAPAPPLDVVPSIKVLILGDSILRPLQQLSWPAPFHVLVLSVSGLTLSRLAASPSSFESAGVRAVLVHAAVNDASKDGPEFEENFSSSCAALGRVALHHPGRAFLLSTACVTRDDSINKRVCFANKTLRELALQHGWAVVSNDNIGVRDLSDTVHLNASGAARLHRNIFHALKALLI